MTYVTALEVREVLGEPVQKLMVAPHPMDPTRWDVVAQTGDVYRYGRFNWRNSPRLALMDEQGIESAILYPATMGTMAEHYVRGVKPLYANLHSYNQWLNEMLGFDYQSGIYTPAVLAIRTIEVLRASALKLLVESSRAARPGSPPAEIAAPSSPAAPHEPRRFVLGLETGISAFV